MSRVHEDVVGQVAEQIAEHQPDIVVCDYPQNPVVTQASHTIATMTTIAAIEQAATYLTNLDGRAEVNVAQVFFTGLPTFSDDALSGYGVRNDLFIDITPVVGRKIAAMDCFESQAAMSATRRSTCVRSTRSNESDRTHRQSSVACLVPDVGVESVDGESEPTVAGDSDDAFRDEPLAGFADSAARQVQRTGDLVSRN